MPQTVHVFPALVVLLALSEPLPGHELLTGETDIATAVDHYIDQQNTDRGRPTAGPADDDTILRRTTLDLAGRIPTSAERNWFLAMPAAERRSQLIAHHAEQQEFAEHLRDVLDAMLLPNHPYHNEFRAYLLWAVEQQRPWDQMFHDMLLPTAPDAPQNGAREFLRSRGRDVDDLTNDTAVLFFGVNVSCAKCHDHPLVADWRQDHYYGMQAFFHRTFVSRANVVLEKPLGSLTFQTTEGEEKPAELMFLNGVTVDDRTPEFTDDERKQIQEQIRELERNDKADQSLAVEFSPRQQLVSLVLSDDSQRYLARNIVNRTWQRLMGIGLVDPPDQMHSGNPPSHPVLLDWLTRDFVTHEYDLRRLVLGIVASDAYARHSVWPSGDEPPDPQSFALAATRPLTPRQLALSLLVAVQNPQRWEDEPSAAKLREELRRQAEGLSREFEQPGEAFQVSVDEALFLNNGDRVQNDLLRDSGDRLLHSLSTHADDEAVVQTAFHCVYCREATDDERDASLQWLGRDIADRKESIRNLIWTMLAGPEMRFNH